jgi:hypothetical protein
VYTVYQCTVSVSGSIGLQSGVTSGTHLSCLHSELVLVDGNLGKRNAIPSYKQVASVTSKCHKCHTCYKCQV